LSRAKQLSGHSSAIQRSSLFASVEDKSKSPIASLLTKTKSLRLKIKMKLKLKLKLKLNRVKPTEVK